MQIDALCRNLNCHPSVVCIDLNLLVVEDDIGRPDLSWRNANQIDSSVFRWFPGQQNVNPSLYI